MFSLLKDAKIIRIGNAVAAGTSDIESDVVDTAGYENCCFIALFGALTATAVTSIKVQQCDTSGGSYADLAGTAASLTAETHDNKIAAVEIHQPKERYLKLVVDRDTANAVVDGVIAILYNGAVSPVTAHSSVVSAEFHHAPAEGTA